MNTNTELITKICTVINDLHFSATEELLSDLDRLIEFHKKKRNVDYFMDEINDRFQEVSFSIDFLEEIFNLSPEEISFIVACYFKHKNKT